MAAIRTPVKASDGAAEVLTGTAAAQIGASAPSKVLLIVHGAGSFRDDYYKPLVAAIEQRLGGPFNYIPVYYADVTNPPAASVAPMTSETDSPEAADFKRRFLAEMQRSYEASAAQSPAGVGALAEGAGNVGGIKLVQVIVREVAEYLFTSRVASQIQARFAAGLNQAAREYDEIVLAALSLGSLVAFDVLKEIADHYNISYWFSLGAPMGKLRRVGARAPDLGAITPTHVARWYNIYDTIDVIAGAIGPQFPGYRIHDIYVHVGNDPSSAHDYFDNAESLDLLANAMRSAG